MWITVAMLFVSILLLISTTTSLVAGTGTPAVLSTSGGEDGMLVIPSSTRWTRLTAGIPTVDGLYSGDESNYYVLGSADGGRGTLYFNRVGDTLYLLMRVDNSVNDNVFGKDSTDAAYVQSVGWNKHKFKDLRGSDHIRVAVTCGNQGWLWDQDYLYDADDDKDPHEHDWLSDPNGNDGGGSPPPGIVSGSSLQWNMNNTSWDITLGGTRSGEKDYKSPDPMSTILVLMAPTNGSGQWFTR